MQKSMRQQSNLTRELKECNQNLQTASQTKAETLERQLDTQSGQTERWQKKATELVDEVKCPITHERIKDSVLCLTDGHRYERAAITKWVEEKGSIARNSTDRYHRQLFLPQPDQLEQNVRNPHIVRWLRSIYCNHPHVGIFHAATSDSEVS